jgi:hypothetical protein
MSNRTKVHKELGHKYFSALTPTQQNETLNRILLLLYDFGDFETGFGLILLHELINIDDFIEQKYKLTTLLKGKICFLLETTKTYYPLEISNVKKEMKALYPQSNKNKNNS